MLWGLEIVTAMLPSIFGYSIFGTGFIQRRVTAVNQQASTGVIEGRNVIMT